MKLQRDLREFIALMTSHGVEYLVVGGHAVGFHGYPRYTGDIDLFIRPTPENAERVSAVLKEFGFPEAESLQPRMLEGERVIALGRPPNRIDLLTSISGLDFDQAWSTSRRAELDGLPLRFLGREALIENKRASGRPKDLADVAELEKMR